MVIGFWVLILRVFGGVLMCGMFWCRFLVMFFRCGCRFVLLVFVDLLVYYGFIGGLFVDDFCIWFNIVVF